MTFDEMIALAAQQAGITEAEGENIATNYYKNLSAVLKDGYGSRITWTQICNFHQKLQGGKQLIKLYIKEIISLIEVRQGKRANPFPVPTRFIWKCYKIMQELGSVIISILHYHYETNKHRLHKKTRQANLQMVGLGLEWLDRLIGAPFTEGHCKAENNLSKTVLRRMSKQGFVQRFRDEYNCYPHFEMQQVWLYPTIEDSLSKVSLPDHLLVVKRNYASNPRR